MTAVSGSTQAGFMTRIDCHTFDSKQATAGDSHFGQVATHQPFGPIEVSLIKNGTLLLCSPAPLFSPYLILFSPCLVFSSLPITRFGL